MSEDNEILLYFETLFNKNSNAKDFAKRKEDAVKASGWEPTDMEYAEELTGWLSSRNNREYTLWVSLQLSFEDMCKNLRTPINHALDDDKLQRTFELKGKCAKLAKDQHGELEEMEKKMFGTQNYEETKEVTKPIRLASKLYK